MMCAILVNEKVDTRRLQMLCVFIKRGSRDGFGN